MLAGGHDPGRALDVLGEAADVAARYGAAVHELRARTSLLRAARAHSPTSVPDHQRALAALHGRLAWQCGLEELAAARHELRPRP